MKVSEVFDKAQDRMSYRPDSTWKLPDVRIGLEFEFENPSGTRYPEGHDAFQAYYHLGEDGSLRDHGYELKFRQPLFGLDLSTALNSAERWCTDREGKHAVTNYRTGLHVHLDARSLELPELRRLLILYAIYEGSFFNFAGPERASSNFCIPWSRVSDHMELIKSIFKEGISAKQVQSNIKSLARYSALNLNALSQFGSIEFRHMEMTKDFTRIKYWINMIMGLMAAATQGAYRPTVMEEVDLIRFLTKDGARTLALEYFPKGFERFLLDAQIWNGALIAQDFAFDGSKLSKGSFNSKVGLANCPLGKFGGYTRFRELNKLDAMVPKPASMFSGTSTTYTLGA